MSDQKKKSPLDASSVEEFDILPVFEDAAANRNSEVSGGKKKNEKTLADFKDENDNLGELPTEKEAEKEKKKKGAPSRKSASPAQSKKSNAKKNSAKKEVSVVESVDPNGASKPAKTLFIISMCLLAPIIILIATVVIVFFALLITAAILIAGALALALVVLVVAGVILALTGIIYGLIQMITKEGFSFYAGEYELGLGLAITGVTIVLSSLIYNGASALVPFVSRQILRLFKFLARKIKSLFLKIYKYSTSL